MPANSYFSVSMFFILLREGLEISIVISVLLSFIDRLALTNKAYRSKLIKNVWLGTLSAALIAIGAGAVIIAM